MKDLMLNNMHEQNGSSTVAHSVNPRDLEPDPRFPYSLRWKVVISFSLLLLFLTAVVAFSLFRYEWIFLVEENQKRIRSLAVNLATNARDPILSTDDLRLGPIVESILAAEDVRYAFLTDHHGKILYHSDPDINGKVFQGSIPPPPQGIIQEEVPIKAENVLVGTAVVGLGKEHLHGAMLATVLGMLPLVGIVALAGVISIYLLASIHVRRLEELESAMQALGAGNLLINVDIPTRDEVGRMAGYFNVMVEQLNLARSKAFRNYMQTISALAAAVEVKDAYTKGHCDRVAGMSAAVAERLDINESVMRDLKLAAVLHDIGKIGVESNIIGKHGPLDESQVKDIRDHPVVGSRILETLSSLNRVSLYVKHHHEHFDGSGYPSGLKGDAIPLPSRIIHLVDAYDAMTTNRPYRSALSKRETRKRILGGIGTQFDPFVVEAFMDLESKGVIDSICKKVEELRAS